MRRLAGSRDVAGFYVPRAGMSRAFVPNIRFKHDETDFSLTVLLHEYAHHFLIGSSRQAMPYWLSEGAAEFLASAFFPKDGSVQIGRPAYHRSADQKRSGQLAAYWRAMAGGKSSLAAAEEAFGDLAQLDKDLTAYEKQRRISYYSLDAEQVPGSPVTVRKVSRGFGEVLPLVIISQRGVDREEAIELLPRVRKVVAEFPDDPDVLAALAEAEFDAGNDDGAIAAADRALAIDPAVKNALVQKGYALFRKAENAEDASAAYRAAMAPFAALNRLENDHPLPLIYYYRSFTESGVEPDENARLALERAAQLAPFDQALWLEAAVMQAGEGSREIARASLAPLAANPHGGSVPELATRMLAALANSPEGTPFDARALQEAQVAAQLGGAGEKPEPSGASD
jgi:tetratricopeptide (TPR) repeat protein